MENNKILKRVELTIDDLEGTLDRISLVSEPAIEVDFFYFSNDKDKFKFIIEDEEQRIVTGPAMIPDMDILRKDNNGDFFNVFFTKETVRKAAEIFFKNSDVNSSNLEHEFDINGVTVFESWIVDVENGKSGGKNYENIADGTWMISYKIDNDIVWDNFIKTGLVRGFSVEGTFLQNFMSVINDDILLNKIEELISSGLDETEIYEQLKSLISEN